VILTSPVIRLARQPTAGGQPRPSDADSLLRHRAKHPRCAA
jgi:hypothetical protein